MDELLDMIGNEAFWEYGFGGKGRTAHIQWKERVDALQDTPTQVIQATASAECKHILTPGDLSTIAFDAMQNRGQLSPWERKRLEDIACVLNDGK